MIFIQSRVVGLTHGGSLEGALAWIEEHQNDADIDQPYMVRKADVMPKPQLSAEEKKKRLEEMKKKIQSRRAERAQVEKGDEQRRERERIERGKMMQETQEERDRLARKREAEKQKKEKEVSKRRTVHCSSMHSFDIDSVEESLGENM
jgi:UBX domain-containing protein 1/4